MIDVLAGQGPCELLTRGKPRPGDRTATVTFRPFSSDGRVKTWIDQWLLWFFR